MTCVTCPARILSAQRAAYICMPARARRQGGARDYRFGSRARAGGRVVDGGVAAEGCRRGLGITGSSVLELALAGASSTAYSSHGACIPSAHMTFACSACIHSSRKDANICVPARDPCRRRASHTCALRAHAPLERASVEKRIIQSSLSSRRRHPAARMACKTREGEMEYGTL